MTTVKTNTEHDASTHDDDLWIPDTEAGRALLLKALLDLERKQAELTKEINSLSFSNIGQG